MSCSQNAKNSSLLNIGKNTEKFSDKEEVFYKDQGGVRKHLLSQEIDLEYEDQKAALWEEERMDFINQDLELSSPTSKRSKFDKPITIDKECQVDINITPSIRICRNATYEDKDAIATVSTISIISKHQQNLQMSHNTQSSNSHLKITS